MIETGRLCFYCEEEIIFNEDCGNWHHVITNLSCIPTPSNILIVEIESSN